MKNSIINQLAALLTVSGILLTAPLTVSAAITGATGTNIVITAGSGTAQSGVTFDNAGNTTSPISVSTTGWYSGTSVIVTATATAANGRNGVTLATGGTVSLTDSAITANFYGVTASGTSTAILNNTTINTGTTGGAHSVNLQTASKLNMTGGAIHTLGNGAYGLNLSGTSSAALNNVSIITDGANGHGVSLNTSSTLTMTGGTIATGTIGARAINAAAASYVDLQDTVINGYGGGIYLTGTSALAPYHADITTQSGDGINLGVSSTATITGGTITTVSGGNGIGLSAGSVIDARDTVINSAGIGVSLSNTSVANLNNASITTRNANAHGISLDTFSTLTMTGGAIATGTNGAYGITANRGSSVNLQNTVIRSYAVGINLSNTSVLAPYHADIVTQNGHGIYLTASSTATVTGGTITTVSGGQGVYANAASRVDLDDSVVINAYAGGVYISNTSVLAPYRANITTQTGQGLYLSNSSTATITGGTITLIAGGGSDGVQTMGGSYLEMNDIVVNASGRAALANGNSTVIVTSGTLINGGYGLYTGGSSNTTLNDTAITTNGSRAIGIAADGGRIVFNRGSVQTTGTRSYGVYFGNPADGYVILSNVNVTTSGEFADGVLFSALHSAPSYFLVMDGGSINAQNAVAIDILKGENRIWDETAALTYSGTYDLFIENADVRGRDGSLVVGNIWSATNAAGDLVAVPIPISVAAVVENSTFTGAASFEGSATSVVSFSNHSVLTGDLIASGSSVTAVMLDDSVMTGTSSVSDSAVLNLSLMNNANWNLTGKSKVTTLAVSGGSITINNVEGDDLTVSGGISGQTSLHLTLSDGVKDQTEIRVVVDETNAMSNSAFALGSEVSSGMYDYILENKTDGAWLIYTAPDPVDPTPPVAPIISSEGDAVLNTAAAVSAFWFTQLDNLHKRMGELRYNKPADGDVLDNVWVRAYGHQINASTNLSGVKGFSETQYGVDLGTDHAWKLDANNLLYTGVFAGYGGADRQFHSSYNGSTDSGYGGLYATWLNHSGWYADVVAKGQYFRNDFTGGDHGKYNSLGVGLSAEFGKQFEFNNGWFAEPSVQVSYLHLMNDNYTTAQGMSVDLADADVAQFYGGVRFGRNLKFSDSWLQPYIKAGGLGQISSGNTVRADGGKWRPNLDGARAVIGAGIVWQLNADSQLHLDYEASFGEKYDKPWGVNLGYRYQF